MCYLDSFYSLQESAVGLMEGCVEILIESKPSGYDSSMVAIDENRHPPQYSDRRLSTTPFSVSSISVYRPV